MADASNIRVRQFNVQKGSGRYMSTTAGAMRVISAGGNVLICDSTLEGVGDDAININININGTTASLTAVDTSINTVSFTPATQYGCCNRLGRYRGVVRRATKFAGPRRGLSVF